MHRKPMIWSKFNPHMMPSKDRPTMGTAIYKEAQGKTEDDESLKISMIWHTTILGWLWLDDDDTFSDLDDANLSLMTQ